METARLHALVDGLLVHGVLRPAHADAAALRRALVRHLDDLAHVLARKDIGAPPRAVGGSS